MVPVTQAAEGFPRRAFSVADVEKMIEVGILDENEHFELIDGEIVPRMSPKHHAHEIIKSRLNRFFGRALGDEWHVAVESSIYLSENTFVEPDICLYPSRLRLEEVKGFDLALAVEVSGGSLSYDKGRKAALYALHGVQELWVIDSKTRRLWRHLGPQPGGWIRIEEIAAEDEVAPKAFPDLKLRIADLA